jgi:hypothetical protein
MPTIASHIWQPSSARWVRIEGFVPVARGCVAAPPQALAWPVKDPGDTLDYVFDLAPALAANHGDAIATLDVAISPANVGDLALVSATADGPRAVLWLSSGQGGTTYTVTVSVTTTGGRALVRSIALPVRALAAAPAGTNALETLAGQVLTGPGGLPLTTN